MTKPDPFLLRNGNYTLEHPVLSNAIREVKEAIFTADDTGIVQVVGCTGVGKSKMVQIIVDDISKSFAEMVKVDRSIIPVARFSVSLLTNRGFNWVTFYQEYLMALKHPEPISSDVKTARDKIIAAHASRKPVAVLIDEAQHILSGCNDEGDVSLRADVLKSLCEKTGGKIVLIGHYDLIPWLRTNGQTSRRNRVTHLGRYQNNETDRRVFREILKSIDQNCASSLDLKLEDHEELLFKGSVGLVGVLRTWLVRAMENSRLEDAKDAITLNALIATQRSTLDLLPILEEAKMGEEDLVETAADKNYFELLINDQIPLKTTEGAGKTRRIRWRGLAKGHRRARREKVGG